MDEKVKVCNKKATVFENIPNFDLARNVAEMRLLSIFSNTVSMCNLSP